MPRPRNPKKKEGENMVKTTVLLPEKLWEKAKMEAVLKRKDFRTVVIEALTAHLGKKKRGGS